MTAAPLLKNTAMTEAEWQTRCELAALYHVVDYLGWTDLINTHFSARVSTCWSGPANWNCWRGR